MVLKICSYCEQIDKTEEQMSSAGSLLFKVGALFTRLQFDFQHADSKEKKVCILNWFFSTCFDCSGQSYPKHKEVASQSTNKQTNQPTDKNPFREKS